MNTLTDFLKNSYTAYHAVRNACLFLIDNGFCELYEGEAWKIERGGKYFVVRGGSSVIAFTVGGAKRPFFRIVASHTDSPALKIKGSLTLHSGGYDKLEVETYGGGIWYSFFDRPLKIAGKTVVREGGELIAKAYASPFAVTIPSLAIHQSRGVNDGFAVNAQTDLMPLIGLNGGELADILPKNTVSSDLFIVPDTQPYLYGADNSLLASPRIDNLTSVLSSVTALVGASGDGISVAACFDNEEVGSRTAQGADSNFLECTLKRVFAALSLTETDFARAMAVSMMISMDNAHATHPNHPEKSDPGYPVTLGGGIVIKSHANKAYVSEALSIATVKTLFDRAGVKHQDFFNRSDTRSGSTLGSFLQSKSGMLAVDLGLPQLAMHSATETIAVSDYEQAKTALSAFYSTPFTIKGSRVKF